MDKILKFEADWCQPCKQLTKELQDVEFAVEPINIEENENLVTQMGIKSVPTIIFLKGGQEVDRLVGFVSREKVENLIKSIYGTDSSDA